MKSVALHNLGCKVNGYEMDFMQQTLEEQGYRIVPFDAKADIYVINTCTVTNVADKKSRQMIRRARKQNPDAIVVAAGCYVQVGDEETLKDKGIDLAIGNNKKKDLGAILGEFIRRREQGMASYD
ncbi:MAG: tRNA (N(6)-L-threonylcarbamoyladenosine(37)-C(2))-methylthiotransferase MtaB, partial [Lachnospiraceae bacterium]|nr:tRNA (N(6)-L-threonylcarbamoyladenosine(37)-C(2))-methylthiotransferase MtaB [Lachnospiraceae bacterium]